MSNQRLLSMADNDTGGSFCQSSLHGLSTTGNTLPAPIIQKMHVDNAQPPIPVHTYFWVPSVKKQFVCVSDLLEFVDLCG
jgi:hypothetical protein